MTPHQSVIPIESDISFRYLQEAQQRGVPQSILDESYRKLVAEDLAKLTQQKVDTGPPSRFHMRGYVDFEVYLDPDPSGVRFRATRRDRQGKDCGQSETVVAFPKAWLHPALGCYDQFRCLSGRPEGHPEVEISRDHIRVAGVMIGKWLADGKVHDLFTLSLNDAGDEYGVRLRLVIHPDFTNIPWEATFCEGGHLGHLGVRVNLPIVRHPMAPTPQKPLRVEGPLRILVLDSRPTNLPALGLDKEYELLEKETADLITSRCIQLVRLQREQGQSQRQALAALAGTFHVFHYMGHARFDGKAHRGYLALENAKGEAEEVSAEDLATELLANTGARLVLLNACETGIDCGPGSLPHALVQAGVLCVIAMRRRIGDRAAITLARLFYRWLVVERYPVEAALARVRLELKQDESIRPWDWVTPVLYSRASDGHIFEFPELWR